MTTSARVRWLDGTIKQVELEGTGAIHRLAPRCRRGPLWTRRRSPSDSQELQALPARRGAPRRLGSSADQSGGDRGVRGARRVEKGPQQEEEQGGGRRRESRGRGDGGAPRSPSASTPASPSASAPASPSACAPAQPASSSSGRRRARGAGPPPSPRPCAPSPRPSGPCWQLTTSSRAGSFVRRPSYSPRSRRRWLWLRLLLLFILLLRGEEEEASMPQPPSSTERRSGPAPLSAPR